MQMSGSLHVVPVIFICSQVFYQCLACILIVRNGSWSITLFKRYRRRDVSIVRKTTAFLIVCVYGLYGAYNGYGLMLHISRIISEFVGFLSFLIDTTATDIAGQQDRTHDL